MTRDKILDRLPFELAAALISDPWFNDIPVIVAVKGNIKREAARAQAVVTKRSGKRGVAVIVLQITGSMIYQGVPGGPMRLRPAFQVIEDVELNNDANGVKKSARQVCRKMVDMFNTPFTLVGIAQGFNAADNSIEPVEIKDAPDTVVSEQLNITCEEHITDIISFCLPPVVSVVPGSNPPLIQIECATPGAQIWYTSDFSYPYPGTPDTGFPESNAMLYAGPFAAALDAPYKIRAAAYAPGSLCTGTVSFSVIITNT